MSVRAIIINPTDRTITETKLPTQPDNQSKGYRGQVKTTDLHKVIGCRTVDMVYLDRQNQVTVNGEGAMAVPPPQKFWQYGDRCGPILGIGIVTGHDLSTDEWFDTTLSLDEVRAAVVFTRRIVRGQKITNTPSGFRVEIVAPIVDERDRRRDNPGRVSLRIARPWCWPGSHDARNTGHATRRTLIVWRNRRRRSARGLDLQYEIQVDVGVVVR